MTKKILWFFEHFEREMPIINLCREQLHAEGVDVEIQPSLLNFLDLSIYGQSYNAIIVPSKNRLLGRVLQNIDIPIICLNYEQMLSGINNALKAPDVLVKQARHLLAWSEDFGYYLKHNGIDPDTIIYSQRPQNEIARQYIDNANFQLPAIVQDAKKQFQNIIYLPLTCLQAFKTDAELVRLAKATGAEKNQLIERKQAVKSQLISLYQEIEKAKDSFFILRPHPGVTIEDHEALISKMGKASFDNLLITDEGNVYDWFNASDIIISNYSSVLLDAHAVGKAAYLFKTDALPLWMHYQWFEEFSVINSFEEASFSNAENRVKKQRESDYPINSHVIADIVKQTLEQKAVILSRKRLYYLASSTRFWADIMRSFMARVDFGNVKVRKDYHNFKNLSH